ncbi:MAG: hypothetical protein IJ605_06900 [Prevotella sp.]|nr:hypothetical protein [Prevotella sp.]
MNDKQSYLRFLIVFAWLLPFAGKAQDALRIRITYSATFKYTTNDRPRTDVNILDIGHHSSLYYSFTAKRRAEINDSVLSRGGSAEDALEVITKKGFGGSRTRYNVYKNYPKAGQSRYARGTPKKVEELERLFYRDEAQHTEQTLGIKMVGRYDASGRLVKQQPKEPCFMELQP